MLKPHEVQRVKYLFEQGMSRRAIALKTGFARETVRKIISGARPERLPLLPADEHDETTLYSGPIERCPTCGGRVYMPCVACRVRQHLAAKTLPLGPAPAEHAPEKRLAAEVLRHGKPQPWEAPNRRCA